MAVNSSALERSSRQKMEHGNGSRGEKFTTGIQSTNSSCRPLCFITLTPAGPPLYLHSCPGGAWRLMPFFPPFPTSASPVSFAHNILPSPFSADKNTLRIVDFMECNSEQSPIPTCIISRRKTFYDHMQISHQPALDFLSVNLH